MNKLPKPGNVVRYVRTAGYMTDQLSISIGDKYIVKKVEILSSGIYVILCGHTGFWSIDRFDIL